MYRNVTTQLSSALVIYLMVLSPVAGNQNTAIDIQPGACAKVIGQCHSPYTISDVSDYIRVFEKHPDGTAYRAIVQEDIQLGPSDLRRRDVLHFNGKGVITEIWSRYQRKIGDGSVQNKTSYPIHNNGGISKVNLQTSQFIDGKFYPSQTSINFDRHGRVEKDDFYPTASMSLAEKEMFSSVLHRVGETFNRAGVVIQNSSEVSVDTLGNIRSVKLSLGQWHDGFYYPANVQMFLNNDGNLDIDDLYTRLNNKNQLDYGIQQYIHVLHEPLTLGAVTFPKGTLVERNDFSYTAAHLLNDTAICGISLQGKSVRLQGYRDKSYSISMHLDHDVVFQGLSLSSSESSTELSDMCVLRKATLKTAAVINGVPLAANREIELDRGGELIGGTLGIDYSFNDITIPAGIAFSNKPQYSVGTILFQGGTVTDGPREYDSSYMQIYKNGTIALGKLNKAAVINGKTYQKGTQLKFSEKGKLISAELR